MEPKRLKSSTNGEKMKKDQKIIIQGLKNVLKNKGMSYEELAQQSQIPLSTLKKIFSGQDLKLNRLLQIIDCLGMNIYEFMDYTKREESLETFIFSIEQEKFFAQHLDYYLFFHKIYRESNSVNEVQNQLNLSENKTWKILRQLEAFGFLEILDFPEIKFTIKGGLRFQKEGPLQNVLFEKSLTSFTQHLIYGPQQMKPLDSPFVRLYYGKVSKSTYDRMLEKLREMQKDLMRETMLDRKLYEVKDLYDITWNLGLAHCNGMDLVFDN